MANVRLCLFNIQKFSIHDGPGIRTAVFFKGCPLRCKWCSNPESQAMGVQRERDRTLAGRLYALGEVMRICMEDKDFYAESGGGVTLTGGEVLAQPEAAAALLAALKAEGIHAALETSGHAPHEAYRVATENADLLLFDIKHHDDERHRKGTGVGNGVILENLRSSVSEGKPLLARIPVIPNYNDSLEDAEEFAKLLRSVGLSEAQLLPFHQFGQKKYAMLDMAYHYDGCKNLRGEDLKEYQNVFAANGVNSFI